MQNSVTIFRFEVFAMIDTHTVVNGYPAGVSTPLSKGHCNKLSQERLRVENIIPFANLNIIGIWIKLNNYCCDLVLCKQKLKTANNFVVANHQTQLRWTI